MKNKSIAFITLLGLLISVNLKAQKTDGIQEDDTTSVKTASPKVLPKYAAVNGYHAGNYKLHGKANMVQPKTNLIAAEASDKKVITNYKMPNNTVEVKKVSAPASNKKVIRNYKMPYNN